MLGDNINVLDCTLRDGGYLNDWDFGKITIGSIISGLVKSNVDFVELGFLRDCDYDENKVLFNSVAEAKRIIPEYVGNTKFTLMVLHDKYNIAKLEDNDGSVYAIRVTFHNYDVDEGLEYARALMSKGYRVFVNPINIMGYTDIELLHLLDKINEVKPFGLSIVDTFGSMKFKHFKKLYALCADHIDKDVFLGLHLHENKLNAFAIAQTFLGSISPKRNAIIDASLYGMGRVPGNLCIELIMDYINDELDTKRYDLSPVLETIHSQILRIKREHDWGYSPEYFLSAKYNLHRNYSEHFVNKGRLSFKAIDDILSQIPNEKKSKFDKNFADELYHEYQNNTVDDMQTVETLKSQVKNRKILLLAPGHSLVSDKESIVTFIAVKNPFVISANFVPSEYFADRYFFSNEKRLSVFDNSADSNKYLITSNIRQLRYNSINYNTYTNSPVRSEVSMLILFNLLYGIGVKEVYVAGFDGFDETKNSFYDHSFDFFTAKQRNVAEANSDIRKCLEMLKGKLSIEFITKSHYED